MEDIYLDTTENQDVIPIEIPGKMDYYFALNNINNSQTGRLDTFTANIFIQESVKLLINAIVLFEKGYSDCAYYSMRQALEMSTTMVYLADIPFQEKEEKLAEWKSESHFPMYGQMMEYLAQNGSVFSDMKEKMAGYFKSIEATKKEINKRVHKQGFKYLYVTKAQFNKEIDSDFYIKEFRKHLEACIGVVAVMRLAIDPLPILLADEEVYYRSPDFLTNPYSQEFVDKYIGAKNISNYKKTAIFLGYYDYFMNQEKKLPSVVDVVKNWYIDKKKADEILSQAHLLDRMDVIAVILAALSEKIAKIYCIGGLHCYFTNTETNRTHMGWNSKDFELYTLNKHPFNLKYDEVYISIVKIHEEDFFIEHNEMFDLDEVKLIKIAYAVFNGQ